MDSLVSIHTQDVALGKYLNGTFSNDWRAIPTESLNIHSQKDYFTFRLIPKERVQRPSVFKFIWSTLRLDNLSLSYGGLLCLLTLMWSLGREVNLYIGFLCFLPILFLHIGMNLFNDYFDHVKGVNRIGSVKSLQQGWVRAIDLYKWGKVALFCGVISGVLVLFFIPQPILVIAALSAIGVLEFSSNRLGLKYRGFGELTLFMLTGPLLAFGYSVAVTGKIALPEFILGNILGLLTLTVIHINNMREIITGSHAGVVNLATRYGFDRAKKIAGFIFILISVLWWFEIVISSRGAWAYGPWLIGVAFLKLTWFRIHSAQSPVSSQLRKLVDLRFSWHQLMILLLIASFFSL